MPKRKLWTRNELILAFNLYCKIPFSKINYKHPLIIQLANIINRTPSAIAWKLVNFASLDETLKQRGVSGAKNIGKLDKEIFTEFTNNWEDLAFESELLFSQFFNQKDSKDIDIIYEKEDLKNLLGNKKGYYKESSVKIRVNQSFFRETILSSYNNKCCITGLNIPELLVASHIIPWSKDEKNRLNPENGLCLNSIYDKAFDRGFLTINQDYKIKLSSKIYEYMPNNEIDNIFLKYLDREIILPDKFLPNKGFLNYHFTNIFLQ